MARRAARALPFLLLLAGLGACRRTQKVDDPLGGLNYLGLAVGCLAGIPGSPPGVPGDDSMSAIGEGYRGDHFDRDIDAYKRFQADAASVPKVLACAARAVAREVGRRGFSVDQAHAGAAEAGVDFHRGPRRGHVEILCFETAGTSHGFFAFPPHYSLVLKAVER